MIGRADIERSKSYVAKNAWQPQASYPCGSIGHAFTFSTFSESRNQTSFSPFSLQEISVLFELVFGHLCYFLTDVPPQSNSPSGYVSIFVLWENKQPCSYHTTLIMITQGQASLGLSFVSQSQTRIASRDSENLVNPFMHVTNYDETFGYLKRVIVTPAVYLCFIEFHQVDIHGTGQKSHCVNTISGFSQCYVLIKQSDSPCPFQF
ncbi:putative senescence-associated protein [Plasmodium yoelii yoelii]|uniref:Senescence-associated protein n=1 Tax=Plasmodium yoelii yoelii TaxID=73239 RepID=Q7RN96_PLAYO|nr:putative senescence-associated protein [Plasmodium yoelii yoelii]